MSDLPGPSIPAIPPEASAPRPRRFTPRRLLVAVLYALAILAISVVASWAALGGEFYNNSYFHNNKSSKSLRMLIPAILDYNASRGSPPASLAQLNLPPSDLLDSYGNPIGYRANGTSWTLTLYGRDGVPGGTEFDADYIADDANYNRPQPTINYSSPAANKRPSFLHFWLKLPTRPTFLFCLATALLAFVQALLYLATEPKPDHPSPGRATFGAIGCLLGSLFIAAILAQATIPTGH